MNEFIEQFVLESREHAEQATQDLLALEKNPANPERLNSALRAFHTLKGGAGIVDFSAMEHAVHATENALIAVRSESQSITSALISECLACLDQVVRWLDVMQGTGKIPVNAHAESDLIVARFARGEESIVDAAATRAPEADVWSNLLLARYPELRDQAKIAIRYRPRPDCFFHGEDPFKRVSTLPHLLAVDLEAASPWPSVELLDPFRCNLVLTALTAADESTVLARVNDVHDRCEVLNLTVTRSLKVESGTKQALALEILEAQIALLREVNADGAIGRWHSAAVVATNVLRHLGNSAGAALVTDAMSQSAAHNAPDLLLTSIEAALTGMTTERVPPRTTTQYERTTQTLRVDAGKIDALVDLTAELTAAKNAFAYIAHAAHEDGNSLAEMIKDRYLVLDRLIDQLQQSVLGIRVLALQHVFQRFVRLTRELASDLSKPTNLLIEGGDTEADKAIVEMLFEPLLHLVRNALDHGIESPAVRAAQGKPPIATIRLRAARQGPHVVVELSDDGGGIDVQKVRQRATERGLLPSESLAGMNDKEVLNLVFAPGFSTKSEVTELSGRGVGMDAVRSSVQRMGGQVDVSSDASRGTTVRLTLPFSVMMTQVMTVYAAGQMFGIPLELVIETVRVPSRSIAPVGAAQVIVLRDRTVPVLELGPLLGIASPQRIESEATLVVVQIDGETGALRVDKLGERMQAMLKPIGGLLANTVGIAGSTLLGDGTVLLVLDLGGLFQ